MYFSCRLDFTHREEPRKRRQEHSREGQCHQETQVYNSHLLAGILMVHFAVQFNPFFIGFQSDGGSEADACDGFPMADGQARGDGAVDIFCVVLE